MHTQELGNLDPQFFEKKKISSFEFNLKNRPSRFEQNQNKFMNRFQMNYNLEAGNMRGSPGLGGNVQIGHQNFGNNNNNNNNPVSISAVNINIFQKDQKCEHVEESKIIPEYSILPSQSKLNPSTLSKTDPLGRIVSSNNLPGEKNPQEECSLHYFKDNLLKPNDRYSAKNFFGIDNLSINNKERSNKSILVSKSNMNLNSVSYSYFNKR